MQGPDVHDPSARVLPTSETASIETSLAFRSIGYKSEPIDGMKDLGIRFDGAQGIIPNDAHGRVTGLSEMGTNIPGMYCSGWVKRGPAGVIANTMEDAFATAEAITEDWRDRKPFLAGGRGWEALKGEAYQRGLRNVSWEDWKRIDHAEKAHGKTSGKPREKITIIPKMLEVLD